MKPALKKARITFLVLTSVLFACWVALTVLFIMTFGKGNPNPAGFVSEMLQQILYAIKIAPISSGQYLDLTGKLTTAKASLLDPILTLSMLGVFGILFLVTLIVAIAKKRYGFIAYALIIVLFAFPAVQVASYTTQFFVYFQLGAKLTDKILAYGTFGLGCAVALFNLIFAIIVPASIVSRKVKEEHIAKEKARKERLAAGAPVIPTAEFVAEPEPKEAPLSKFELANLIREIVRDEVSRSEIGRQQPAPQAPIIVTTGEKETPKEQPGSSRVQTVTGATFGGPLVVQYFYGIAPTTQQPAPQSEPEVKEEPAPVVEEPTPVVEEPTPVVEEPAPVEEPTPVVEAPVVAPVVEEPAPVSKTESLPEDLKKDDIVGLYMEDGVLYAHKKEENATGVVLDDAEVAEHLEALAVALCDSLNNCAAYC